MASRDGPPQSDGPPPRDRVVYFEPLPLERSASDIVSANRPPPSEETASIDTPRGRLSWSEPAKDCHQKVRRLPSSLSSPDLSALTEAEIAANSTKVSDSSLSSSRVRDKSKRRPSRSSKKEASGARKPSRHHNTHRHDDAKESERSSSHRSHDRSNKKQRSQSKSGGSHKSHHSQHRRHAETPSHSVLNLYLFAPFQIYT